MCVYMCIYIYICVCVYMCIYIYHDIWRDAHVFLDYT